jgi:hypothetical protein
VYVDNYCERTAPGLWGEPVNALSNFAFLIASAVLLWLLSSQPHGKRAALSVWLLPITLGVVGVCSLAFHTFATSLTGALDSLSIVVFILIAVVTLVHWMWGVPWKWAWLAAPAFLVLSFGFNLATGAVLGGYLPALVGLLGFGLAIRFTVAPPQSRHGDRLLWASAIFAASLTLRTLDLPLCQGFPVGTHFAWHCLNAIVLFIVAYTVIRRWQASL